MYGLGCRFYGLEVRGLGFRARIEGGESSFLVNSVMVLGFSGFTDEVSQISLLCLGFNKVYG